MNPLLKESTHRFKTVEFHSIKLENFMPAISESISIARKNIANIKSNNEIYLLLIIFYKVSHYYL